MEVKHEKNPRSVPGHGHAPWPDCLRQHPAGILPGNRRLGPDPGGSQGHHTVLIITTGYY